MPMPLGKQVFLAGVAASGSCAILYYLVQSKYPMKCPRQGRLLVLLALPPLKEILQMLSAD